MNSQLHNLIGQKTIQNNQLYILIEVIDDGPLLVFQCQSTDGANKKQIQHDQHGNAKRRSFPTITISCLNELKTDLHPTLKELLAPAEHANLLSQLL